MDHADVIALLRDDPAARRLLNTASPARLAYLAIDGSPRAVPVVYQFDGERFVLATPAGAPKVKAMQANPDVALTIDTDAHPPTAVLVRGRAAVSLVDGVVPEFLEANRRRLSAEDFAGFEEAVAAQWKQMARIDITPTWATVIDETRPPASHLP